MITAAVTSSLRVLRIRPCGCARIVVGVAADQRHHGHAGLETAQAQGQLGKQQQAERR